jgi:SAM-dependent methyltransferase
MQKTIDATTEYSSTVKNRSSVLDRPAVIRPVRAVREWLAHPLTRGIDIDDPCTTAYRKRIIREKTFLMRIYRKWYSDLAAALPPGPGAVLELGSGAGFLAEYVPGLVTSEIFYLQGVSLVADACALPFADKSLKAIVMTDVLHHLPEARRFFAEAARCLRPGAVIAMHEPWVSRWSRLVYPLTHYEPFLPETSSWEFPTTGPLSGANGALPWIIFERDRLAFESTFPEFEIRLVKPGTPLGYLASGGVSTRSIMPGRAYPAWRLVETLLSPWMNTWAMFAHVRLVRK